MAAANLNGCKESHITLNSDLKRALNRLSARTPRTISTPVKSKRAAVALIIRLAPSSPQAKATLAEPEPVRSLNEFFNLDWVAQNGSVAELLFIKRAARAGDRYSSHVAFPGGHLDATDESLQHCAVRETWEEVGLDLTDESKFISVGQLDDREMTTNLGKRLLLTLSAFVWLQISPENYSFKLEPAEIASTHWVPISYLVNPNCHMLSGNLPHRLAPRNVAVRSILSCVLGRIHFKSIILPNKPSAISPNVKVPAPDAVMTLYGHSCGVALDLTSLMSEISHPNFEALQSPASLSAIFPWYRRFFYNLTSGVSANPFNEKGVRSTVRSLAWLKLYPTDNQVFSLSPSVTINSPVFRMPDLNFWIWIFGLRYRSLVRDWQSSHFKNEIMERSTNYPGLVLASLYRSIRKALIVTILLRALTFIGAATWLALHLLW